MYLLAKIILEFTWIIMSQMIYNFLHIESTLSAQLSIILPDGAYQDKVYYSKSVWKIHSLKAKEKPKIKNLKFFSNFKFKKSERKSNYNESSKHGLGRLSDAGCTD